MSGADVLRTVTQELPEIPVVMLTSGARDYLTRPFIPDELVVRVNAILKSARTKMRRPPRSAASYGRRYPPSAPLPTPKLASPGRSIRSFWTAPYRWPIGSCCARGWIMTAGGRPTRGGMAALLLFLVIRRDAMVADRIRTVIALCGGR